jgi:hypothetical protein
MFVLLDTRERNLKCQLNEGFTAQDILWVHSSVCSMYDDRMRVVYIRDLSSANDSVKLETFFFM